MPTLTDLERQVGELNEQVGGLLSRLNDAPSSIQITPEVRKAGVGDGIGGTRTAMDEMIARRIRASEQLDEMRDSFRLKSDRALHAMFAKQAAKRDGGVPLYDWLAAGGQSLSARFAGPGGIGSVLDPDVSKALDTSTATALIRQDLEPILYELYVRQFPLFDAIRREPANGLVHAYNQQTSFGDADWIGELDTVTDDRGTYVRQTTNVGILATRRGVSLKSQFAVLQGGAGFNPERLELTSGLRAMSSRFQKTLLYGNWTDNTGTINNEVGPYDDDSFDGNRKLLNTARARNVDPATNPDTTGNLRRAVDSAVLEISESGGGGAAGSDNLVLFGSPYELVTADEQMDDKTRIILNSGQTDVTQGVRVPRFYTLEGTLPFYKVPGGQQTGYTYSASPAPSTGANGVNSGATVRDIDILDLDTLSIPYLGADGPTVIEIPIGVSGQLTHLFIIFFMGGYAMHVPTWNNKIRVKVA